MADISQIQTPDGTTYDINAKRVNGHSVQSDVPANAVFGGVSDVTVNDVSIVENNIAKLKKVNAYYDGIVPAGGSVSTQTQSTRFLREDGQWSAPSYSANTTYTFSTGTSQGQIRVQPSNGEGYDVTVKGLAIKNGTVVHADATSSMTGTLYACCNDQNGYLAVQVPWTNTTYSLSTGDSNGQIKVTPSSGSAYNVSVKGLGSAAYLTASTSATANTVAQRQGNGYLYAVYYNTSCGSEDPNSFTSYPAFIDSNGWLRKSSRLNFAKHLTNQSISSPGYFVTLTSSWGSFGYSTPAQARSGLGLGSMATQNTGSWEPIHPYLWAEITRNSVTQAANSNDYWTMTAKTFPARSGYSRYVPVINFSNNNIVCTRWEINSSNQVIIHTRNLASSSQTFNIYIVAMYLRDTKLF